MALAPLPGELVVLNITVSAESSLSAPLAQIQPVKTPVWNRESFPGHTGEHCNGYGLPSYRTSIIILIQKLFLLHSIEQNI